jgi:two-component system, OmpR family, copper resistance phosphate regulon response regulator CusR
MTILVVEDETRIASFIRKGLRAHGWDVEAVETGEEALSRLEHGDVSLVVLDLGLPDVDGLEVLERVRGTGSDVPVIILSAHSEVTDRVRGFTLGADDYMPKPFAFEELAARVSARLRSRDEL